MNSVFVRRRCCRYASVLQIKLICVVPGADVSPKMHDWCLLPLFIYCARVVSGRRYQRNALAAPAPFMRAFFNGSVRDFSRLCGRQDWLYMTSCKGLPSSGKALMVR